MNKKTILSIFLLTFMPFILSPLSAQELTVKSMRQMPDDLTAMLFENQRQDLNEDYAGIVKVLLAVDGAKFRSQYLMEQKQYEISEYWVWLAKGAKRLRIHAPGYLPLDVNFFDDYGIKVEPKQTYELIVTLPMGYTPSAQAEAVIDIPAAIHESEMTPSEMVDKGMDYYYGRNGVEKDYQEMAKWLRKAAERGDVTGQIYLGNMYDKGIGVEKDYAEALRLYRLAADQGNSLGQNNVGYMYREGHGVEKDYTEAEKWFRLSAEQGDSVGLCNLGYMYLNGLGVEKDYAEAFKWYHQAAEQGYVGAQINLSYMYIEGLGVEKDYSEAVKWYRNAAEQGNAAGQLGLGNMYLAGYGVERNYSEAFKWYRLSALQGLSAGQYLLGYMYKEGLGVDQDVSQAKYWLEKAAAQGNENAKNILKSLNGN